MSLNEWSLVLMIVTALSWGFYDLYLYYRIKVKKEIVTKTLSQLITGFSYYSPMLPFILGVLIGHWMWPGGC